tara:strand:- start:194 stop:448 length:255 start_codon:yes stop_codon:yes gene_type:complete
MAVTKDDVGDPKALPERLDQIEPPVGRFLADATSDLLMGCFGKDVEIIMPLSITGVVNPEASRYPTSRASMSQRLHSGGGWVGK